MSESLVFAPNLLTSAQMTDEQRAVWKALFPSHVGAARAIVGHELETKVQEKMPEIDLATIRKVIIPSLELLPDPIFIGSSERPPYGYFVCATEEELSTDASRFRQRGIVSLKRHHRRMKFLSQASRVRIQTELPIRRDDIGG